MYKKEEFYQLFRSVPLPFKVFSFPESGTVPEIRTNSPLYYSHKMTTDLTLQVFKECGFRPEANAMLCHILIGRSFSDDQLQSLNDFQKCCHFSSTYLMGMKSELHNRMKELKQRLGKDVPFYPRSYYPPDDVEELLEAWPTRKYWIIKAPALSRAREMRIASSSEEKAPLLPYVVEEYILHPYLITGRKFDIRLYALITSVNPLTIYYHRQGLGLFAVHKYKDDDDDNMNLNDLQMHLTNYEINKGSDLFVECNGTDEKIENSKWSLPFLWKYFDDIGIDSKKLRQEIEDISTEAIIACMCSIRNAQKKNIKNHRKSSFEFVGVDILLDSDLKPYLLEINISPSMAGTSKLDEKIKLEVAHDLYNIVRILDVSAKNPHECMGYFAYEQEYFLSKNKKFEFNVLSNDEQNSSGIMNGLFGLFSNDDRKVESIQLSREKAVINGLLDPWNSPSFAEYTIIREFIEEQERSRGFHRAYPRKKNIKQFEKCFDAYNYEDIVLNEWIKMDKRKRFEVLIENFDFYYKGLQKCYEIRDKGLNSNKIIVENKDGKEEKTDQMQQKNEIEKIDSDQNINANIDQNINANIDQNINANIDQNINANINQNINAYIDQNINAYIDQNINANIDQNINANIDQNINANIDVNNTNKNETDENKTNVDNANTVKENDEKINSNINLFNGEEQNIGLSGEGTSTENFIFIVEEEEDGDDQNNSGCQIQ